MKHTANEGVLRGVPVALLVTLLLQGGTAIWWVSAKARDGFFLQQRVEALETVVSQRRRSEEAMFERLVRIEERVNAQIAMLDRIEKQMTARRREGVRE